MICHKCGSDKNNIMFEESFDCECGKENIIGIHMCPDCSLMWRSYNNEVLEMTEMYFDDFVNGTMGNPYVISGDEKEVLKNMEKELLKVDRIRKGESKSMSDYIHNCIRCGAVAHEAKDGFYKCGDCGFEWEVVSFE